MRPISLGAIVDRVQRRGRKPDDQLRRSEVVGQSQRVDIRSAIDEARFSALHYTTFALCFLVVLLDGFDTAAIGYIAPSLTTEWGMARSDLAPVLSAALLGLTFGALCAGPLADRFGRRAMLIWATVEIGIASLASAQAGDLTQLVALRFLTGLGLGAAMPNAVTLTSEYCPVRRRALVTNMIFCGFPLGAALGGILAAWMIPAFGWRSVLVLGGVAPLVLAAVLIVALPESLRYLVAKGAAPDRIRAILSRIAPTTAQASEFTLEEASGGSKQVGLALIVSRSYLLGSLMLWLAYFMGLVIFYALVNWMPILFRDAGMDPGRAALIAAVFPLGGVGAILLGALMDRFNATFVVAVAFLMTAVAVAAIGQVQGQLGLLVIAVFVAGTLMNMAQSSLPTLAAGFYPTEARATGVAWMMGIGRFGGIAGSFLVGTLSARAITLPMIFAIVALPAIIAAVALLVKLALSRAAAAPSITPVAPRA